MPSASFLGDCWCLQHSWANTNSFACSTDWTHQYFCLVGCPLSRPKWHWLLWENWSKTPGQGTLADQECGTGAECLWQPLSSPKRIQVKAVLCFYLVLDKDSYCFVKDSPALRALPGDSAAHTHLPSHAFPYPAATRPAACEKHFYYIDMLFMVKIFFIVFNAQVYIL